MLNLDKLGAFRGSANSGFTQCYVGFLEVKCQSSSCVMGLTGL